MGVKPPLPIRKKTLIFHQRKKYEPLRSRGGGIQTLVVRPPKKKTFFNVLLLLGKSKKKILIGSAIKMGSVKCLQLRKITFLGILF